MNVFTFITITFVSSLALAKPVVNKDWSLDDTTETCRALTQRVIEGNTFQLELTWQKDGSQPLEAWIRHLDGPMAPQAYILKTETKPQQSFPFTVLRDNQSGELYWQIPMDPTSLVSYIKRQTRLLVMAQIPEGASMQTKTIDFSLRGSSATVDALNAECAKGRTLTSSAFEKFFLDTKYQTLNPLAVSSQETQSLRRLYAEASLKFQEKESLQKQLTALNSQYAKQIQELSKVTGTLDQLIQKELASLESQKNQSQNLIAEFEQNLLLTEKNIRAKEAQLIEANTAYDQAWQVLNPLESEYQRLDTLLSSSQAQVKKQQANLTQNDNAIQSKNSAIRSLQAEADSLRQSIRDLENRQFDTRNLLYETERLARNFRASSEARDVLRHHPVIQYCQRQGASDCGNLRYSVERDVQQNVDAIERQFSGNVYSVQGNLDSIANNIRRQDDRIRSINNYEIPSLNQDISQLRSQRPALERLVQQAQDEATQRQAALRTYDQKVGYSAKKADVTAKAQVVSRLQGEIKALESTKNSTNLRAENERKNLQQLDKKIQDVMAKIRSSQDRSSELNQALAPYFEAKDRLEIAENLAQQMLEKHRTQFLKVLSVK